ncbi:hypothetical protein HON36_05225 [Candidatus Parcubacteria bacterium]|jgi:hypothetical protein|nr:hypothetical protein [Candidatus Parcubacteria bacterium]
MEYPFDYRSAKTHNLVTTADRSGAIPIPIALGLDKQAKDEHVRSQINRSRRMDDY